MKSIDMKLYRNERLRESDEVFQKAVVDTDNSSQIEVIIKRHEYSRIQRVV